MKEILAGGLDFAISDLNIIAKKTFDDGEWQIWQLSDEEYDKLDNVFEEQWSEDYGWWRYSGGSTMGSVNKRFSINGHWLNAWASDYKLLNKYNSIVDYIYNALNLSSERNICSLCVDLAEQNGMTLGELFDKYEGNNKVKNK